jgi:hypothetical protein
MIDETGNKFGSMTVIKILPSRKIGNKLIKFVEVKCDCGLISEKRLDNIKRKNTKGCSHTCSSTSHGMSGSRVYKCWDNMITRVSRESHKSFKHYEDLIEGEKIDPLWMNFNNFIQDMGLPSFEMKQAFSIDRIDNKLGYSKSNCKWSTQREQLLNQERSINNMFSQKDLQTIVDFANLVSRRSLTEKFGKRSFTVKDIGEVFGLGNATMTKILKGDYFES